MKAHVGKALRTLHLLCLVRNLLDFVCRTFQLIDNLDDR